jgi:GNAT superfamily N-acetyltransferase
MIEAIRLAALRWSMEASAAVRREREDPRGRKPRQGERMPMTLRRAEPGEEAALLAFASREPYFNLFLISNLSEGLNAYQEAWVQEGVGILMRRHGSWVIDAGPRPEQFDFTAAARLIDAFPPSLVRVLSGRPEGVAPLCARLRQHRPSINHDLFAVLSEPPPPVPHVGAPRPARPEDFEALAALYADAGDMSRSREAVAAVLPRTWVVEDAGQITAAAIITAQSERAAMIGAVFTPPPFRRRGYATTLIHALGSAILASGRHACLFYHNPAARRVYLRLGFREIGPWLLARFPAAGDRNGHG